MRDNKSTSHSHQNRNKRSTNQSYICRLCRQSHPLRKCKRFLDMNILKRQEIVRKYGYCTNCLAHEHSGNTCFTTTGCRYCKKAHHSLLHTHARLESKKRKETEGFS
ncbi:uncharacterized protein LOC142225137 [Haematobia irritans]|uniref:uncharacterized protein LOC142225137 n=1 Tax=Haematobia irritans TaxID=7368 RepID=UPI003F4F84B6